MNGKYMKAMIGLVMLMVLTVLMAGMTGCTVIQDKAMESANKYGVGGVLQDFREAEGQAAGMISAKGANVQKSLVNMRGERHTDGVVERTVIDRILVPADTIPPPVFTQPPVQPAEPVTGNPVTAASNAPTDTVEGLLEAFPKVGQ